MPADGKQFRVMLRMQIKPGMERQFEQEWTAVGTTVTGDSANLGQWLAKSAEEKGVYYIVSDWVNEERFREFEHSAAHVHHRERLHPFRCGGSMTTMHIMTHMPGSCRGAE
jgi:heme-degrading monooxygenase HmoA